MQTQVEKTEVAAVIETAKPARTRKPAAPKAEAKPAKAATAKKGADKSKATPIKKAQAAAYSILPQFRPKAGRNLQAHTEAALQLFNLYKKGAKVRRADLARVIGDTAISYHLKQDSFVSPEQGMIALSDIGRDAFKARQDGLDAELVAEFSAVFSTGKAGDKVKAACGKEIAKFIREAA